MREGGGTRYRTGFRWSATIAALPMPVLAAVMLVIGLAESQAVLLGLGAGFLAFGALLVWLTVPYWRFVQLTGTELAIPRLARTDRIRLADINGVGLCYLQAQRATGWRLAIWKQDRAEPVWVLRYASVRDPVGSSTAAQQATDMWRRIGDCQGADGPLRSQAHQHDVSSPWSMITSIWCPDDGALYDPRRAGGPRRQSSD